MLRIEVVLHYSGINMLMTAGSEVVSIPIYLKLLSPILSYLITVKRWRSSRQQTHKDSRNEFCPKLQSIIYLASYQNRWKKRCVWVSPAALPLSHWSSEQHWTFMNIYEDWPYTCTPQSTLWTGRILDPNCEQTISFQEPQFPLVCNCPRYVCPELN